MAERVLKGHNSELTETMARLMRKSSMCLRCYTSKCSMNCPKLIAEWEQKTETNSKRLQAHMTLMLPLEQTDI